MLQLKQTGTLLKLYEMFCVMFHWHLDNGEAFLSLVFTGCAPDVASQSYINFTLIHYQ